MRLGDALRGAGDAASPPRGALDGERGWRYPEEDGRTWGGTSIPLGKGTAAGAGCPGAHRGLGFGYPHARLSPG